MKKNKQLKRAEKERIEKKKECESSCGEWIGSEKEDERVRVREREEEGVWG